MNNQIIYVITFVTTDNTKKFFNKYDSEEDAYNRLSNLIRLDPKASITYDAKTKIFSAKYNYINEFVYYIEPITLEEFNKTYNEVTQDWLSDHVHALKEKWSAVTTVNDTLFVKNTSNNLVAHSLNSIIP